jgi:hypothetical protein
MKRLIVVVMLAGTAFGFLKSYEIMPVKASWSGKVSGDPQYGGIAQTITANFDSVAYCQLFVGDVGDTSHHFSVEIYEYPDGVEPVASRYDVGARYGHSWLEFALQTPAGQKFTRGKQYLVRFTRPEDSIQYYYSEAVGNLYGHGQLMAPGEQPPPSPDADLCMRLYGKARADGIFSVMSVIAMANEPGNPYRPYDMENWEYCAKREAELGVECEKLGYGYWRYLQPTGPDDWRWGWLDTLIACYARNHVEPALDPKRTRRGTLPDPKRDTSHIS